ncbi:VOC family protein [Actinoplanes sp. NPDC049118]|uniref:VOC family protein n=1 Tax=Actinoplanes sp. NPDC049118 TaxID=3155769 RepID=UPI0033F725DF
MAFQRSADYERPTRPNEAGHQQMMMHLDIEVPDLRRAVTAAIAAGATEASYQPQDTVRVMLDPVGHPFCLYVDSSG